MFNNKKGALSIEFLFAILFILFCFVALLTIQFTVFYRSMATYEILRISRVEGFLNNKSFTDEMKFDRNEYNPSEIKRKIIEYWRNNQMVYIGNIVEVIFANTGMNIKRSEFKNPFSKYILEYNAYLFKKLNIPSQNIYWIEPTKPKEIEESKERCN